MVHSGSESVSESESKGIGVDSDTDSDPDPEINQITVYPPEQLRTLQNNGQALVSPEPSASKLNSRAAVNVALIWICSSHLLLILS